MTLINPPVVNTYLEMTDFPITYDSARKLLGYFIDDDVNTFYRGDYSFTCIPSTPAGNFTAWAICTGDELVEVVRYKEVANKYPDLVRSLDLPYPLSCPYYFVGVAELPDEYILSNYTDSLLFQLDDIENVLSELQDVEPSVEEVRLERVYL